MPVAPGSVVEAFDVIKHICAGQVAGFVDPFFAPVLFQTAEYGFARRVDAPMSRMASDVGQVSGG